MRHTVRAMKRASELTALSREHHVALEVALRLKRSTEADNVAVRAMALRFWRTEGEQHFRLEERVLLPAFARHVGNDDAGVARVLADHAEITQRMAALEGEESPGVAELNALGELLSEHVRYEERTLFGRIEAALDRAELSDVGAALDTAGQAHDPPRA